MCSSCFKKCFLSPPSVRSTSFYLETMQTLHSSDGPNCFLQMLRWVIRNLQDINPISIAIHKRKSWQWATMNYKVIGLVQEQVLSIYNRQTKQKNSQIASLTHTLTIIFSYSQVWETDFWPLRLKVPCQTLCSLLPDYWMADVCMPLDIWQLIFISWIEFLIFILLLLTFYTINK